MEAPSGAVRDADCISLAEFADAWGVHRDTARRWAQQGRFPGNSARKIGKTWVVSRPRLNRWLHEQETPA